MRKFILKIIGLTDLINEQKKSNDILLDILKEVRKNNQLVEANNKAYNIK